MVNTAHGKIWPRKIGLCRINDNKENSQWQDPYSVKFLINNKAGKQNKSSEPKKIIWKKIKNWFR